MKTFDEFLNESIKIKKLKFKKDIEEPLYISEDFYEMFTNNGYKPEEFLEAKDAKIVSHAFAIVKQFQEQGFEEGIFDY